MSAETDDRSRNGRTSFWTKVFSGESISNEQKLGMLILVAAAVSEVLGR